MTQSSATAATQPADTAQYAAQISDRDAVHKTYQAEFEEIVRFLKNDLSVLIQCDKILTEHIYEYICHRAGKKWILEDGSRAERPATPTDTRRAFDRATQGQAPSQDPAQALATIIKNLRDDELIVLRSLDMLDTPPLIEVLYQGASSHRKPQLLGFIDPSLEVKPVLLNRFAIRTSLMGLPRYTQPTREQPSPYTVAHLITAEEFQRFAKFEPEDLYKNVSGLNPVQFRDAMRFIKAEMVPQSDAREIYDRIRFFKTTTSNDIDIPDTKFEQIGGYDQVKDELKRIIALVSGRISGINEKEREQLVPRGFIFHGPPGTGKTLFAKAIANEMNATIQMVSGPEVMDKYVGQSESNLRQIFATARRNAPAVILFDEFDSLASQRSTYNDGGSRANNAVVAQLLTELDGFRQEQMVLVIGTTNRLDIIDEALLRPSRFKPIAIGNPDAIARREVAHIHAQRFGVETIIHELYELVLTHLAAWEAADDHTIPAAFLSALFAQHPPYQTRYEANAQQERFAIELQTLFALVASAQEQQSASPDSAANPLIERLRERLLSIAPGYGLDLLSQPDTPAQQLHTSPMQADLQELFHFVQTQQAAPAAGFSAANFFQNLLTLVAEYTENFNNDEIRAIFQEAKMEHHLEGQLITPRYLGMKIGMIRHRRDERSVVHLDTNRGRR